MGTLSGVNIRLQHLHRDTTHITFKIVEENRCQTYIQDNLRMIIFLNIKFGALPKFGISAQLSTRYFCSLV